MSETITNSVEAWAVYDLDTKKFWSTSYRDSLTDMPSRTWTSEAKAKKALMDGMVIRSRLYRRTYRNNYVVVKVKQFRSVEVCEHLEFDAKTNAAICEYLYDKNYGRVAMFWEEMIKKGKETDVEYLMDTGEFNNSKWGSKTSRPSNEQVKEHRSVLRGLGIKTRSFRELRGVFGFVDADQALKSRLSIPHSFAMSVADLKREAIEAANKKTD